MANLLARLNTYQSLNNATAEEKKYGQGIYFNFGDESEMYKNGTFKKVIDAVLEQALTSEEQKYRDIAGDVKKLQAQQGPSSTLEILVYDPKANEFLRNVDDESSMVVGLDDKVRSYIVEREVSNDGETNKIDYLDIVVRLNTAVGRK